MFWQSVDNGARLGHALPSVRPCRTATVRVDTPGVAFIRDNGSGRAAIEDVAGGRGFAVEAGAEADPEGRTPHASIQLSRSQNTAARHPTSAPVHQGRRYGP